MFSITRRLEIAAAHALDLPYQSPCANLHGHNWKIEVVCQREELDERGMVTDFAEIDKAVLQYDHQNLNEMLQPATAENLARTIAEAIPHCVRVTVTESEGAEACYTK